MDGRQFYGVIHESSLTESETKTQNYKHTSVPPAGRLKESKKEKILQLPSHWVRLSGRHLYQFPEECRPHRFPGLRVPGWSEHAQRGATTGSQGTGGPVPHGSPLGLFWGIAPRTARAALPSETHRRVPAGARAALPLSDLTSFSLQISPLSDSQPRSCLLSQT